MSSIRQDSLTGRWVIIAKQRQGRPNEFKDRFRSLSDQPLDNEQCPFCPGREDQTPAEVLATGRIPLAAADSPGWRVRVFPNKFPAVQPQKHSPGMNDSIPLRREGSATGSHEVVVCCPGHEDSLGTLPATDLFEILTVVRRRIQAQISENKTARYVLAFGNHGPEAGATLAHSHLQIISIPVVPALVVDKIKNFLGYQASAGHCLLCDTIVQEEAAEVRLVAANPSWVALAPWASFFPGQLRLIPRRHCSSMLDCRENELRDLAQLLNSCLQGLNRHTPGASYNLVIHNGALAAEGRQGYGNEELDGLSGYHQELFHWHLEVLPRLSRQAGFEAGTGFAINSLPPEEVADLFRPERG